MATYAAQKNLVDFIMCDHALIDDRLSGYFNALELFRFRQASDILGGAVEPYKKKRWAEIATPFSLFAACESMYYSFAFLKDQAVDTMYQEVFKALQNLLDLNEEYEAEDEGTSRFCKLLREVCVCMQVRGSMILIYRALRGKRLDVLNCNEFSAAARSLSKRPTKCEHPYLQRMKTNMASEIELVCRLFTAQAAMSNYQFKDTVVLLQQCKSLLKGWRKSVERGTAKLGVKLGADGATTGAARAPPVRKARTPSFGFWLGFDTGSASKHSSKGSRPAKVATILPPVFPWLQLYLDVCFAKAALFFRSILANPAALTGVECDLHRRAVGGGSPKNNLTDPAFDGAAGEGGLATGGDGPSLPGAKCLDFFSLADTMRRKCRDASVEVTVGLTLNVGNVTREQPLSITHGYTCPAYCVRNGEGVGEGKGGEAQVEGGSGEDEGESRPQGLKAWPLIFVHPPEQAIQFDKHWPNIVSLLVGGLPELDGYKKPLYHHEPNLDRKASYYLAFVDQNVALVVVTHSNHTAPLRSVTEFFAAVCPTLRMETVFARLRPLKI